MPSEAQGKRLPGIKQEAQPTITYTDTNITYPHLYTFFGLPQAQSMLDEMDGNHQQQAHYNYM